MIVKSILLAGGVLVGLGVSGEPLVVRRDCEVPASWRRGLVCGRDFIPKLRGVYWAEIGATNAPAGFSVYRECAVGIDGRMPPGVNDLVSGGKWKLGGEKDGWARLLPESERRKKPYRLWDFLAGTNRGAKGADRLYGTSWTNRPFFLSLDERPAFRLNKTYPLADRDDYAAFLANHQNFIGTYVMGEFDSDSAFYYMYFPTLTKDGAAFERQQTAFPCTFKDYAWNTDLLDTWIPEAVVRCREYCFGEDRLWGMSAKSPGMLAVFAAAGFKGITYEATTQGMNGNWRFATPYLRGAARQFGTDYGWYTANFYDGYHRGDSPKAKPQGGENSLQGKDPRYPFFGPDRGASFSLIDRQNAYGWLIGARYVEPENWSSYHMRKLPDGSQVPSEAARVFQRLYELSQAVDRGVPHTPLALCLPLHEKVSREGGTDLFTSLRPGAALFTLVPGDPGPDPLRQRGVEGGFYNSEFPDFFDVVAADASRGDGKVLAALRHYRAAVVLGRYKKWTLAHPELRKYAEGGGTLFVSCDCIVSENLDRTMCGVSFPSRKIALSDGVLVDERGGRVQLSEQYPLRVGEPTTAKVLWTDGGGTPIAYVNDFGRGRVVTIAADGMLPYGWDSTWGIRNHVEYERDIGKIRRGEVRFEILREIFRRVRDETMPFAVAGDVHWGLNRCESHWLLWIFNNKGVTNYLDEAPVIDRSCDARVVVTPRAGVKIGRVRDIRERLADPGSAVTRITRLDGGAFETVVPAGAWAAFEIEE